MACVHYKQHLILSHAVFDPAEKSWQAQIEIVVPKITGLICACKEDAEVAGVEAAMRLIDSSPRLATAAASRPQLG